MLKFSRLFGAVIVLALYAAPAMAQSMGGFDGMLSGNFGNTSLSNGGGHANDWGFDGAGAFNLGWSNVSVQADAGWHDFTDHGSYDDWNAGGAVYWTGHWARLGADAGYQSEGGNLSGHATNYGAFGELYAGSMFTLGVKGGGFSGDAGLSGENIGVQAVAYAWRDFAVTGTYDYFHISHAGNENDWGAQLEWLVSERVPVSVWGGYEHSDVANVGHANTFLAGLKLYTDGFGPAALVDRQRGGVEQWGTKFSPAGFVY